ncbi:TetR/AcrR family transcriptional regulator [Neobacillus notoginsengisoli]|uniref:TetR/AcrR family transcriptional regulator n=1 Tax=Neobacillus notoginsengisoli TaxID=1578198 RepID=A0A417YT48_9BACI|nr:TetR/AcrR family transcriptional regulator [Neobacillus notoginsengisoli]RHW40222.1 TetR/AcrR family transcriptional regulator [Neobacillus notoginsengisoli]
MKKREVKASVKDELLVRRRRSQMIRGAVALFKQKGFHRTTTREIAKASGFSIGTLYEYIRTKEDVLYLVCDSIYDQVSGKLLKGLTGKGGTLEHLKLAIADYFRIVDEMQDEVLVMYQEAKSLSHDALPYVLRKENEMASMFGKLLARCVENGEIHLSEKEAELISHDIIVLGQMWAFRRWSLAKRFTLEEYIDHQTELLLSGIGKGNIGGQLSGPAKMGGGER